MKMTEEEKKAYEKEREAARREKRRKKLEKHAVDCPHCGQSGLDHMTQCPYCGGELTPRGYRPMNENTARKLKTVGTVIGFAVAAIVVIVVLTMKS